MKFLIFLSITIIEFVFGKYNLVDPNPSCYSMGINYCPKISNITTNEYMSWRERTHQLLLNSMRIDPVNFVSNFTNNTMAYACPIKNTIPFRYSTNSQQAAKQQSFFLNVTGCKFSHDTCPAYCYLYNNDCAWYTRVKKYETKWTTLGENIAISRTDPLSPLKQFSNSSGHCVNLFGTYKNIGIGSIGRIWTQVFTSTSLQENIKNPLYDGTHWKGSPLFSLNELHFIANYYDFAVPTNITVILNNKTSYPLILKSGTRNRGTYIYRFDNFTSSSCLKYFFQVYVNNTMYKLPEEGFFLTQGINNCTINYTPTF